MKEFLKIIKEKKIKESMSFVEFIPPEILTIYKIIIESEELIKEYKQIDIKIRKKKSEVDHIKNKESSELGSLEIENIEIHIEELQEKKDHMLQQIDNFKIIYDNYFKSCGERVLSPEYLIQDKEKYYIIEAFKQAITSARANRNIIDKESHLFFHKIGVDSVSAQNDVIEYFKEENKAYANKENSKKYLYNMSIMFLEECAIKYKGCMVKYNGKRQYQQ